MDCKKSGVCAKKTLGYKERCPDERSAYCTELAEIKQCGRTLVYVDESGFQAESIRRYAYAPKGERVFDLISSQRARKTTLVAARIADQFTAATLFEGSCNAERFNPWLEAELCPRLCCNDVVIMDNARSHKTKRTRALIESSGGTLMYLPPYSPDYNPIEYDFAHLKRSREYNPDKPLEDIIQMYQ
jgi:putative transposase